MTNSIALTIRREVLLNSLANLKNIITEKSPLAILNHVKLEAKNGELFIFASDMDIMVSEALKAEITMQGSLTVNAKAFYDIIKKMADEVIDVKGNADTGRLNIKGKSCRFTLPCLNSEEFPIIPRDDFDCNVDIKIEEFLKLLNKARFAASDNEAQYQLNGVNLQLRESKLQAQACNGHKLARIATEACSVENFPNIILPSKAIEVIIRILKKPNVDVKITASTTKICLEYDNLVIVSKLIDGDFPNIDSVFPSDDPLFSVMFIREILLNAVGRVALASNELSHAITFTFTENLLTISTRGQENQTAEEDLQVICAMEKFVINFNSKYMIEILSNTSSESLRFDFRNGKSPIIIGHNFADANEVYLISPISG